MQFVYILQSLEFPDKHYVGCTNDVAERLRRHNAGQSGFEDRAKAFAFEKYLKSGSGRPFAKKHF